MKYKNSTATTKVKDLLGGSVVVYSDNPCLVTKAWHYGDVITYGEKPPDADYRVLVRLSDGDIYLARLESEVMVLELPERS